MVLAERALVDPAVGEDEEVLGHQAGALEDLARIEIDLGKDHVDTAPGRLGRHLGHGGQPAGRLHLPGRGGAGLAVGRVAAQADHLDEEAAHAKLLEQGRHAVQVVDVQPGHGVDAAGGEARGHGPADVGGAHREHPLAADRIVDQCVRAVQAEAQVIEFLRGDPVQEVVEQVAVGVHGDRVAQGLGRADDGRQVRVQGGLAAQEDEIGLTLRPGEQLEPALHRGQRQGGGAVLGRVDVAVAAAQVAGGEQVKEDVALTGLKAHGARLGCSGHGESSGVWARV